MTSPGSKPVVEATPPADTADTHTPAKPASSSTNAFPFRPTDSKSPFISSCTTFCARCELMPKN